MTYCCQRIFIKYKLGWLMSSFPISPRFAKMLPSRRQPVESSKVRHPDTKDRSNPGEREPLHLRFTRFAITLQAPQTVCRNSPAFTAAAGNCGLYIKHPVFDNQETVGAQKGNNGPLRNAEFRLRSVLGILYIFQFVSFVWFFPFNREGIFRNFFVSQSEIRIKIGRSKLWKLSRF